MAETSNSFQRDDSLPWPQNTSTGHEAIQRHIEGDLRAQAKTLESIRFTDVLTSYIATGDAETLMRDIEALPAVAALRQVESDRASEVTEQLTKDVLARIHYVIPQAALDAIVLGLEARHQMIAPFLAQEQKDQLTIAELKAALKAREAEARNQDSEIAIRDAKLLQVEAGLADFSGKQQWVRSIIESSGAPQEFLVEPAVRAAIAEETAPTLVLDEPLASVTNLARGTLDIVIHEPADAQLEKVS